MNQIATSTLAYRRRHSEVGTNEHRPEDHSQSVSQTAAGESPRWRYRLDNRGNPHCRYEPVHPLDENEGARTLGMACPDEMSDLILNVVHGHSC